MNVFRSFIIILLLAFVFAVRPAVAKHRISLVDINRATKAEFARLPGISEELAESIIKYRRENDYFDDIEELLEVEGMSREIYDQILPYLIFSPPEAQRADEIITDLETMEEEEEEYFLDLGVDISRLELYRNNPLDINTAAYSQFLELPGIEPEDAEAIIELRKEKQGFESIDELKEVLDEETFEMISPFIAVLDEEEVSELHGDVRVTADVTYPYDDYYFE
ncbi:MAG: helix-hairpin-helix domain-containing protein, partial [Elusimicrobiota bacterium]|nr:helix-hairpin-helix domain-containing protein [Elusimicrobiota bacterium]